MRFFLTLVLCSVVGFPALAQKLDLSQKASLSVQRKHKLSKPQKDCLKNMSKGAFYAAAYFSPGTDTCRSVRNVPSLKNARILAKAGCEARRKAGEPACIELGHIDRKSKARTGTEGLPIWAIIKLKQSHGKRRQYSGNFIAVAMSGAPIGGFAIENTQKLAQEAALKFCKRELRNIEDAISEAELAVARKAGFLKCKISHVSQIR